MPIEFMYVHMLGCKYGSTLAYGLGNLGGVVGKQVKQYIHKCRYLLTFRLLSTQQRPSATAGAINTASRQRARPIDGKRMDCVVFLVFSI